MESPQEHSNTHSAPVEMSPVLERLRKPSRARRNSDDDSVRSGNTTTRRRTKAAARASSISQSSVASTDTTFGNDGISDLELEAMRQVFDQFDEDRSGSIDAEELYKVMKFIGHEMTETQVMELLEQVDVDKSGTVEFEEFTQMMLLYKEAARFKLNEDVGRAEQAKLKAKNVPSDAVQAALWQIVAITFAVYYWLAVLYTDTVSNDDEVNDLMHAQLGVEVICTLVIIADMCISARLNDASDTTSYISKSYLKFQLLPDLLTLLPWHLMVPAGTTQRVLYHFKLIRLVRGLIFYWRESDRIQATRRYVTIHFFIIPLLKAFIGFISFVQLAAIVDGAIHDRSYVMSLFVVSYSATGVGYGTSDTRKDNIVNQRIYAMFLCFVAQALNAAVVGRIATMVMQSDITALKHHEVSHALEVAQIGRFPMPLVHDVVGYREHCVEDSLSEAYKELISNLPHALQSNITLFVKLRMIQDATLFHFAHRSTQVAIAKELQSLIYRPKEIIFSVGQTVSSLYMIAYGYISLYDAQGNCFKTVRTGDCFGENSLVFGQEDSSFTAIPVNYCEVFNLPRLNFQSVLRRFPLFRSKIEQIAQERKKNMDHQIQVSLGGDKTKEETLEQLAEAQDDMLELVGFHGGNTDERVTLQKCMVEIQEIEGLVADIEEKGISINSEALAISTLGNPAALGFTTAAPGDAFGSGSGQAANSVSLSGMSGIMQTGVAPDLGSQSLQDDVVVEDTTSVEGDADHEDHVPKANFQAFCEASDGEEVVSSGFPSGNNISEGQFGAHGTMNHLDIPSSVGSEVAPPPAPAGRKKKVRSSSGEAATLTEDRQQSTLVEDYDDESFDADHHQANNST